MYDSNAITAKQIVQTIIDKTAFGAEIINVGVEDLSKIPPNCLFLGFFCD